MITGVKVEGIFQRWKRPINYQWGGAEPEEAPQSSHKRTVHTGRSISMLIFFFHADLKCFFPCSGQLPQRWLEITNKSLIGVLDGQFYSVEQRKVLARYPTVNHYMLNPVYINSPQNCLSIMHRPLVSALWTSGWYGHGWHKALRGEKGTQHSGVGGGFEVGRGRGHQL